MKNCVYLKSVILDIYIKIYLISLLSISCFTFIEASKILVCVPCPSVSHQVVFYPLINELVRRGHEVVFITTDPIYPKGDRPANLTEIDTHDVSYKIWREQVLTSDTTEGTKEDQYRQVEIMIPIVAKSFELQMQTPEVQDLIKKKARFDLIIVEGISKSAQSLSYVFKAPMIAMSSLGALQNNYHVIGAPIYPKLLYPIFWHQKLNNMTVFEKIKVLWDTYKIEEFYRKFYIKENKAVKRLFGPDTPSLEELGNNVHMLFINLYPIWEHNRPVPPGVVFIGGIHQKPQKELPKGLKDYLDSSERGVVYFSLGTNVSPSTLSAEKIQALINGLAKLPYDVLMKWDYDVLPGIGNNTKVAKWLPQSDLLRHPNIKAFVTQGGLQSFDEALTGGVPLVGIPMLGDQWYNVEIYVRLKIGVGLLMEEVTADILANAVHTVIDDENYRHNMNNLREKVRDQPQSALDRAVWWTEHVLRHKGASHLRAPAANMSWAEYLDVELMAVLALAVLLVLSASVTALYLLLRFVRKISNLSVKLKVA